ncbi:phage recombination protein Bet [Cupriavidus sp. a3]|uniref:phage recombination protein Bet n=1 Tax=Cupriavidus sp. a3 TaxID=3242158 RepID=UPI003D9C29D2
MSTAAVERPAPNQSLVAKFANRYSIDANKLMATLKATAFRQRGDAQITDEQMAALLIVADQHGLNPFTKEIYAYPDKNNGIVPVVSVDGWSRIINEHPQFDGYEFIYSDETAQHKGKLSFLWIECVIHRKDRNRPTAVREYFDEVVRELNFATPWDTHPKRMHRHKSLIQSARLAFGFAGIYDEDEAQRIVERDMGAADVARPVAGQVVAMPQAKPKAKQIEHQEATTLQQPARSQQQAEPVERAATEQPARRTQQSREFEDVEANDLATDGEKQWVRSKLGSADIAVADALQAIGLSTPESLDGLTRDGFVALQDYIKESC